MGERAKVDRWNLAFVNSAIGSADG